MLKYLARYVAGAAISGRRLASLEGGRVTFRWKNDRQNGREHWMTLPAVEFLRRFGQHVLPPGFMRIRGYGLWSNASREAALPRCREQEKRQAMTDDRWSAHAVVHRRLSPLWDWHEHYADKGLVIIGLTRGRPRCAVRSPRPHAS